MVDPTKVLGGMIDVIERSDGGLIARYYATYHDRLQESFEAFKELNGAKATLSIAARLHVVASDNDTRKDFVTAAENFRGSLNNIRLLPNPRMPQGDFTHSPDIADLHGHIDSIENWCNTTLGSINTAFLNTTVNNDTAAASPQQRAWVSRTAQYLGLRTSVLRNTAIKQDVQTPEINLEPLDMIFTELVKAEHAYLTRLGNLWTSIQYGVPPEPGHWEHMRSLFHRDKPASS